MGIVNVNDDSFCGDGSLEFGSVMEQIRQQVAAGAEIIDVGAESARTNREAITVSEEIDRLRPVIRAFHRECWNQPAPLLSVNTWRPEVIAAILPEGVDLLNDLSALPEATNARLCAAHGTALLIMHSVGLPKVPHTHVTHPNLWATLEAFFAEKIALAESAGLTREQLVLDPGIDFAKQGADNLRIYAGIQRLHRFGSVVLLPVSRKSVIGKVLNLPNPLERDAGTVACMAAGVRAGVQIFRVHNVIAATQAIRVLDWLHGPEENFPCPREGLLG